jgi:hypothetical protein
MRRLGTTAAEASQLNGTVGNSRGRTIENVRFRRSVNTSSGTSSAARAQIILVRYKDVAAQGPRLSGSAPQVRGPRVRVRF